MASGINMSFLHSVWTEIEQQAWHWWERATGKGGLMTDLVTGLFIFIVTLFMARWISNAMKKLSRRWVHADADRTLPEFISQVVYWMVFALGIVVMLNRLGIETASFITVLGAASLSIGLALQGTLGNVASGLMILVTKPYRIGDIVKVGDVSGRVHQLGVFNTEIDDDNNLRVYVPNSKIFSNEITNLTTNIERKIELVVEVDYKTDLPHAIQLLKAAGESFSGGTRDVWAGAEKFNDSGIVLRTILWVAPAQFLQTRSDLILGIKSTFDAHGIVIPYPHQVQVNAA